jgi:hypothetical protein
MRLRRNELCPIHRLVSGYGREPMQKERTIIIRIGVQRIEDPHDPGYREHRSPAAMRKLLNRKIVEPDRKCAFCHEEFPDCNDIVPDSRDRGLNRHPQPSPSLLGRSGTMPHSLPLTLGKKMRTPDRMNSSRSATSIQCAAGEVVEFRPDSLTPTCAQRSGRNAGIFRCRLRAQKSSWLVDNAEDGHVSPPFLDASRPRQEFGPNRSERFSSHRTMPQTNP